MKNAIRNIVLTILMVTMVLSDVTPVFASEICSTKDQTLIQYYETTASALGVDTADATYINGKIRVFNDELVSNPTKWTLKIGDTKIRTLTASSYGAPITFTYQPTTNNYYSFTFITSTGQLTYYHKTDTQYTITSVITLMIEEGVQTLYFQADASNSSSYKTTLTATKNNLGYYDFGTISFTHDGQSFSLHIRINSNTNKMIITRDGKEYEYSVTGTGKYETLYCEALVPAQEIDMDYMASSLTKQTFANAQTVHYDYDDIDDALSGQKYKLTLVNNKTGKTATAQVQSFIGYWKRNEDSGTGVGDGTYGEHGGQIQVVCQWDERNSSACSSIKSLYSSESQRPFAVYGSSLTYGTVDREYTQQRVTTYNNRTWSADGWSGALTASQAYSGLNSDYGLLQYRTAAIEWTSQPWEEYTGAKARTCSNSGTCKYDTRDRYAYQTKSWSAWSDYIYTSKDNDENNDWDSKVRYSRQTRSWGAWTGYNYGALDVAGCALSSTCETDSTTLYRKKTATYGGWSDWSGWSTGACATSDTKNCETKTVYAWRSMGSWSEWEKTLLNVSCSTANTSAGGDKDISLQTTDCKTETTYRKRTRSLLNYTYDTFGDYKTSMYDWTAGCKERTGENTECGIKRYSYGGWGSKSTSKYGSYQEGCTSVYSSNILCGVDHYNTTWGTAQSSKYGSYQSECSSDKQKSTCNTYNTDGVKCGYSYGAWSDWSDYSTTSCSTSETKECSSRKEYRSKTCSTYYTDGAKCGYNSWVKQSVTAVASCTASSGTTDKYECSGKCVATVGDCVKGKYKRTYSTRTAKSCSAAGCSSWGSWSSWGTTSCSAQTNEKQCESRTTNKYRTRSATAKSCEDAGCKTWNYKTTYTCPTAKTAVYKTCYLYECPSTKTPVYNSCTSYSCPHYRTPNYSSWSLWSEYTSTACVSGDLVDCDSKTTNYKRTRSWNAWTDYNYSYGATSSTIDYKSQNRTRNQTRTKSWGDWSNYIYSSCTESASVTCDSATRYRKKEMTDWSAASNYIYDYSEECASSDLCKQSGKTMWKKRELSDWSSTIYGKTADGLYTLTSCTDSQTKKCLTQQQMQRSTSSVSGDYSSWRTASSFDSISYNTDAYAYQYRYNNGTTVAEDYKGGSTKGVGYHYYISEGATTNKFIYTAARKFTSYQSSERMTQSEISSFATSIGNNAANYSALSKAENESEAGYITWDEYNDNIKDKKYYTYYTQATAASNKFLGETRFIPYIFIKRHYRATSKQFLIDGYNDEAKTLNNSYKKTKESTKTVMMTASTVKCCAVYPDCEACKDDVCTTYPNSDECYCRTHPLEYPRCSVDYCSDPSNYAELACACARDPQVCTPSKTDGSVIYYNYWAPLENYDQYTMPTNWAGYATLVEEIKNSDLANYKIQVTLTSEDLANMRTWVQRNPDKVGTGEMIRAFSHIFDSKDPEVSRYLSGN